MIKGCMTIDGRPHIVIGLSRINCGRLLDNHPISFDGALVGLPGVMITVLGGETEGEIAEDLRALGPNSLPDPGATT